VQIEYSYEPELLGTAGAAKRLAPFLDEPFYVVYGDVFTNVDYGRLARLHEENKQRTGAVAALTMALYRVPNPSECGLVEIDEMGRVLRFVEKPPPDEVFTDLANAGILVCDVQVLDLIPSHTVVDFGRDLIPRLLASDVAVFGEPISPQEYVIDIGTPSGFDRAQLLAQAHQLSA
jgi:NDP-sugar pyrophosphorylase family protein